jgi:hypothetical protein
VWGGVAGCGGDEGTPLTGDLAETDTHNITIMMSIKSNEIKQVKKHMHNIKILAALTSVCVSLKPYNFWKQSAQHKTWVSLFFNNFCFNPQNIQLHVHHTYKFSSYLTHNTPHLHYKKASQ